MSWIILLLAGLFEVGWAIGLKYTDGFTRPLPTALTVCAMLISLGLLGLAMKELPLRTAEPWRLRPPWRQRALNCVRELKSKTLAQSMCGQTNDNPDVSDDGGADFNTATSDQHTNTKEFRVNESSDSVNVQETESGHLQSHPSGTVQHTSS